MLSPIINTDVKMPAAMMDALNIHEAICVVTKVESVTEESVREFLRNRYGAKFAASFKPEYLFSSQET
jgi:hypothetical protein